ncbi:MAG: DUF5658 family protein [Candidatus Aminicenantaceae bacterium]
MTMTMMTINMRRLVLAMFILVAAASLPAQEVLPQHLTETAPAAPVFVVSQMTTTPLTASALFPSEVLNTADRPKLVIPAASFSLTPPQEIGRTDASLYLKNHFRKHKWENTLFDATMIAHAALNIADYFSTREALKYPGLEEGNPLMKPFVKNDLAFAAVKIGLTAGNHLLMKKIHKENKTLAWIVSLTSNLLLSYVVVHNYNLIDQARR